MNRIVVVPSAPYTITPHLRRFSLRGGATPCIYDDVNKTCKRIVSINDDTVAYKVRIIREGWRPLIKVSVLFGELEQTLRVVEHVLNIKYAYPDTSLLISVCPGLKGVLQRYPGLRPALNPSMWESLVKAIVSQQISMRLALRIISKLVLNIGEKKIIGSEIVYGFPTPSVILEAGASRLREMGLSKRKVEYIIDIAKRIVKQGYNLEGVVNLQPKNAIGELMKFRGVGAWTAKLAYMAYTGNMDILLPEDLSVSKGFKLAQCSLNVLEKMTTCAGLISYLASILSETKKMK